MKNKIKIKITLIICLIYLFKSITFWGIKQKVSIIFYFLKYFITRDKTDYNLYKALKHGFVGLKGRILTKNKRIFVENLVKHKLRSPKQKSINRLTMICDDTCDGEKYSKKSKKLHKNRDNSLKKVVKTHNIVFLAFTVGIGNQSYKYIFDFRIWSKGGKKKPQLFIDMLKDFRNYLIKCGIKPVKGYFQNIVITFDSGYSYDYILKIIDELGFYFVGKYHHKKKHLIEGTEITVTDWLRSRFHKKTFSCVNSRYHIKCSYYKYVSIEDCKWKFLLCLFRSKGHKRRPRRLLVTNMYKSKYYTIIERYQQRYYIEGIFRDLKQLFGFNNFHRVDSYSNFDDHISLCILRYDFVQEVKRVNRLKSKSNGYVVKLIRKELNTFTPVELDKWFSTIVSEAFSFHNTT